jgi:hypothetical protein
MLRSDFPCDALAPFSLRGLLILTFGIAADFAGFVTSQKLTEKERREAEERAWRRPSRPAPHDEGSVLGHSTLALFDQPGDGIPPESLRFG